MHNPVGVVTHVKPEIERKMLIRTLCDFSASGLVPMLDAEKKVFCYRVRKTEEGVECDGESLRYTIIALLGLIEYERHLGPSPISIPTVFNETLAKSTFIACAGDAGLLLWLTAMAAPHQLGEICSRLGITRTWKNYGDAALGMTTELSWLLTGLCYTMLKMSHPLPGLADATIEIYNLIKGNYGGKGIFRHQHGKSIAGAFRGNLGCFADQVYPIYALTKFAETHSNKEAIVMVKQCCETICELQGRQGQWWWHYDARTGKRAGRYPVFSVHQEGMAPMALLAASEEMGTDYEEPVYKGLEWILGKNEFGMDMRDFTRNTIWRSFYRKKWKQNQELLSTMIGIRADENSPTDLEILYECRPYSFGWLLYAFAGRVFEKTSIHPPNSKGK